MKHSRMANSFGERYRHLAAGDAEAPGVELEVGDAQHRRHGLVAAATEQRAHARISSGNANGFWT